MHRLRMNLSTQQLLTETTSMSWMIRGFRLPQFANSSDSALKWPCHILITRTSQIHWNGDSWFWKTMHICNLISESTLSLSFSFLLSVLFLLFFPYLQYEYFNAVLINEVDEEGNNVELGGEFILQPNDHFNNLSVNLSLSVVQVPTNMYNKGTMCKCAERPMKFIGFPLFGNPIN